MASLKNAATWIAFGSIVKSEFTRRATSPHVSTCLRGNQLPRHQERIYSNPLHPRLFTTSTRSQQQPLHQPTPSSPPRPSKRKPSKRHTPQQQNPLIKGTGKFRHIDPNTPTLSITAYCAAETYSLSLARSILVQEETYTPDPFDTSLFPQVLHVQTPETVARAGVGDVFIFPSGCVVTWNVPEPLGLDLVERALVPAAEGTGHVERMEAEDLAYIEDAGSRETRMVGDTIILGTKASADADEHDELDLSSLSEASGPSASAQAATPLNATLAKIAISSALARSTKLSILENLLTSYFTSTRSIPHTLSSGQPLRYTRSQILRKTGELLSIRAQLNLSSELTDSLPDIFWDSPHALGLEKYYEMVGRALDVGERIRGLNEKMDYASEIAGVLRERLSEKHGVMLEWMIIGLICIEVGFGGVHLWREGKEGRENERVRGLVEGWFERELARGEGMEVIG